MSATTERYDSRIAGIPRVVEAAADDRSIRFAQSNLLDELPGAAFALITLVYILSSLLSLL